MKETITHNKFALLLFGIIILLIAYPFFENTLHSNFILYLFTFVILGHGLSCVKPSRANKIILLALFIVSLTTRILILYKFDPMILTLHMIITVIFFAIVLWLIFSDIILKKEVRTETLFEAASFYFMMGLGWATLYILIEMIYPASFVISTYGYSHGVVGRDLFYFSFVTLTTLGYGDITPVTTLARVFSFLQATFGVLYIAILVARLASNFKLDQVSKK